MSAPAPQPGSARTIDEVIARLDDIIARSIREQDRLGYFAALYRKVTVKVKEVNYKEFSLLDFEFKDQGHPRRKLLNLYGRAVWPRLGTGGSPVKFKDPKRQAKRELVLEELCKALRFDDPVLTRTIATHKKRLAFRWRVASTLHTAFYSVGCVTGAAGLNWLVKIVRPILRSFVTESVTYSNFALIAIVGLLFSLLTLLFVSVISRLAFKTAAALTDKNFADTLCATTAVYLVTELSRDDVLTDPEKRKALLGRTNDLARNINLLRLRYFSNSEPNRIWFEEHCKHMESYIRERERWITAPLETTLKDLRNDFYTLAATYLTGCYGKFEWAIKDLNAEPQPPTKARRLLTAFPRSVGVLLPLTIICFFLWKPYYLERVGLGTNTLALILLAWFLLAIDSTLKLGIVSGLVNLAKEIKNIN